MNKLLALWLIIFSAGCVWQPIEYSASDEASAGAALEAFRETGELEHFFDEAVAYAVFPSSLRAGTGFGGAFGNGWLFEGGQVSGKVMVVEFFAGVNFGAQAYRTILFFRNEDVVRRFRKGRFEFTGQANAAAVKAGKSLTPSYHKDVAMFVQVRGGLLLEASVGTQRYDFFPLAKNPAD